MALGIVSPGSVYIFLFTDFSITFVSIYRLCLLSYVFHHYYHPPTHHVGVAILYRGFLSTCTVSPGMLGRVPWLDGAEVSCRYCGFHFGPLVGLNMSPGYGRLWGGG